MTDSRRYVPTNISSNWPSLQRWIALAAPLLNSRQSQISESASGAQTTANAASSVAEAAQIAASNAVLLANTAQSTATTALPETGELRIFGGDVPAGFLECNGQEVSRITYADLYAANVVGAGEGDGLTTFTLPTIKAVVMDNSGSATTSLDSIENLIIKFGVKT